MTGRRQLHVVQLLKDQPLLRQILAVVGTVFLGAVTAIVIVGSLTVLKIDGQALQRQLLFVEQGTQARFAQVPTEQESVTIWDDAVLRLRSNDQSWIDENVGVWMNSYFGHDRVYVLNPEDAPIYAMESGERASASLYARDRAHIEPLVQALRSSIAATVAGGNAPADGDGQEAGGSLGAKDYVWLPTGLAIASVKPVVPSSKAIWQDPQDAFLHVSIVFLDAPFLQVIADQYDIQNLVLDPASPWDADDRAAYPLRDANGVTLGVLRWAPQLPGMAGVVHLLPVMVMVALALASVLAWLSNKVWQTVQELQAREEQTRYLAFHDALTGLPNRLRFDVNLARAVERQRAALGSSLALHLVDIDRFKNVNDTLGHPMGDELVRQIAQRLRDLVGNEDCIARVGGDEFAVLQPDLRSKADADHLAAGILRAFEPPFSLDGEQVPVTASVGIVIASTPLETTDLLRRADIALYEAKGQGRSRSQVFTGEMDEAVRRRRLIERDLRRALETGTQLELYYQPQFAAGSLVVTGAEALVRWNHPTKGLLPPDAFIGIAEERGLIDDLGTWVLREACGMALRLDLQHISINVSPVQFRTPDFVAHVIQALRDTGLPPWRLELELTEGVLMSEGERVVDDLEELRAAGISIALDDFGTGYSSMNYLTRYNVDRIKIDQSFVHKIGLSREADAVIRAIISLGRSLQRKITAEGVETEEQLAHLTELGCDELQGYLLSKPLSAAHFIDFLRSHDGSHDRLLA